MKRWAFVLGAAAAVGAAAVVLGILLRRKHGDAGDDLAGAIAECFDRIHEIEGELSRLRPAAEPAR